MHAPAMYVSLLSYVCVQPGQHTYDMTNVQIHTHAQFMLCVCIYIYTHTHTHKYTYIHICMHVLIAYPSPQVKAVGTLAMIDEGELDWKVIGVSMSDPKAASINSVADLEKAFPGQIDAVSQ
jgi:hypothetical protein